MADKELPPLLTVENWQERFSEFGYDSTILTGYMEALSEILPTLKNMAETKQDFHELKKELLNFCKGQHDLLNDINEKWNSEDPEQYNLPMIPGPGC